MLVRSLISCDAFVVGDGSALREILHPEKTKVDIRYSLAHAAVQPGARTWPHRLKHAEVYFVLEGEGRMHVDEESQDVGPGDCIYIPPHSTQRIENTGTEPLFFLCIVDPAWTPEIEEVLTSTPSANSTGG